MGGERDYSLSVQVDVLEQREHNLRVGAPPYGTAYEYRIVCSQVRSLAFVRGEFAIGRLLLGQFYQRSVTQRGRFSLRHFWG